MLYLYISFYILILDVGSWYAEKIGRGDAERDYQEKLLPAIRVSKFKVPVDV